MSVDRQVDVEVFQLYLFLGGVSRGGDGIGGMRITTFLSPMIRRSNTVCERDVGNFS